MTGTRRRSSRLAGWIGMWGWVGSLLAALAVFVVGGFAGYAGSATVRGEAVLNGPAAIAKTARDAQARGATNDLGAALPCYFAETGPTYIACGPVYLDAEEGQGGTTSASA
ncbi:MAG: hypothetical protein ACYDEN_14240 [Acidimicrobiales bacterium]